MNDLLKIAVVPFAVMSFSLAAHAQTSVYQDPDKCMADVTALDSDDDGYITGDEMGNRGTIATNVDTDGDGRISKDELTVGCNDKLVEALEDDS